MENGNTFILTILNLAFGNGAKFFVENVITLPYTSLGFYKHDDKAVHHKFIISYLPPINHIFFVIHTLLHYYPWEMTRVNIPYQLFNPGKLTHVWLGNLVV